MYNFKEIKQQVHDVIKYSQCFDVKLNGIDTILEKWKKNKEYFITKMNDSLIYEYPEKISFQLDESSKLQKLEAFGNRIYTHYKQYSLVAFIDALKIDDFYNNLTSMEYTLNIENKIITIPENFKVVKAFKFFVKDEETLKLSQNEASRIIQENIVNGRLCLSVHPLDYLSLSENVCGWRSCHALDGEYRSGNLNYMVDSSTVICYLREEKQAILPHFPENVVWNSKKWRVLLFFSKDMNMMFAGRQYPFTADSALDIIKDKVLSNFTNFKWSEWCNTTYSHFKDEKSGRRFYLNQLIPVGKGLKNIKDFVIDQKETYQFNDLLKSTCYLPWWSYKETWYSELYFTGVGLTSDETMFYIGDACPCPICGKNNISFSDKIICEECAINNHDFDDEYWFECDVCGSMTHEEDGHYLDFSGAHVCDYCYRNETTTCQRCGAVDLTEEFEYITYVSEERQFLCRHCYECSKKAPSSLNVENIEIVF